MSMVGANYEQLEAGAARMRQAADELDAHARGIQGTIGGLSWFGQVATAFLNMWNGGHRRQLASTAQFIRQAADELARQAAQQRSASEGLIGLPSQMPWIVRPDLPSGLPSQMPWIHRPDLGLPNGIEPPRWWDSVSLPEDFLDYLQERYGNGATLIDITTKFAEYTKHADLGSLMSMSTKVNLPGLIGAGSFGIDVFQWVNRWDEQSGLETAWDGVGIAIDGVGLVFPVIGAAKGTWDITYWATSNAVQWIDREYDTSGAFVDSVIAREGKVPNYEGLPGFINYVGDGFQNLFSPKSWGF